VERSDTHQSNFFLFPATCNKTHQAKTRQHHGVGLRLQDGGYTLVEVKAGQTFQRSWLSALHTVSRHIGHRTRRAVVYGGDSDFDLSDASVIGWRSLSLAG